MNEEEKERVATERKEALEKIMVDLLPQLAAIGRLEGFRLIVQWKDGFSADSAMAPEENFKAVLDVARRNPKNN